MKTFGKIIRATTSTYMISLVGVLGIVALLEMENEVFTMPFSTNVLLVISSLIFLLSKRFAFSTFLDPDGHRRACIARQIQRTGF
jgi:hypothetical protein